MKSAMKTPIKLELSRAHTPVRSAATVVYLHLTVTCTLSHVNDFISNTLSNL